MDTIETLEITTTKSAKTIYFGLLSLYVVMFVCGLLIEVSDYTGYTQSLENIFKAYAEVFAIYFLLKNLLFPFLIYNFFKAIRDKVDLPEEYKTLRYFLDLLVPIANIKLAYIITKTTLETMGLKSILTWFFPILVSLFLVIFHFTFIRAISEGDIEEMLGNGNEVIDKIASVIEVLFNLSGLFLAYLSYRFINKKSQT